MKTHKNQEIELAPRRSFNFRQHVTCPGKLNLPDGVRPQCSGVACKRDLAMTLKVVRERLGGLNDIQQACNGGGKATDRYTAIGPHPDVNPFLPVALSVRNFNGSTQAVEARATLDKRPDDNRSR